MNGKNQLSYQSTRREIKLITTTPNHFVCQLDFFLESPCYTLDRLRTYPEKVSIPQKLFPSNLMISLTVLAALQQIIIFYVNATQELANKFITQSRKCVARQVN